MDALTINVLKSIGTIPIAILILKLIFKKSIIFKVSICAVSLAIFAAIMKVFEILGPRYIQYIATPSSIIVGTLLFLYINKMLRIPLETSFNHVNEISKGNLDIEITKSKSNDELGILTNVMVALDNKLNEIIGAVTIYSENLVAASAQMSGATEQLSQGATEQASSIEEVSSTIEGIISNIEQNTHNVQQTETISIDAYDSIKLVADKGVKAMEANKTIAEKITIINDITFQTNILALNAAFEAVRAGDHGGRFAVVAGEVQKLAENSKKAADEIIGLAQDSLLLSEEAGYLIQDTSPKIENTTRLIQEIAAASLEQNEGANQVNNAIHELNSITQQNASSSEELTSSAEELAGQAEHLRESISFFSTDANKQQKPTYTELKKNL